MALHDPVGAEFYVPLRKAEQVLDALFVIGAVLSIAVLLVDRGAFPVGYDVVQALFALDVVVLFFLGLAVRLHWSTRAHDKRVADLLSHSFDVALIASPSEGFYSSTASDPFRRLSLSLLENSFFTGRILQRMLKSARAKIALYVLAWGFAVFYRATDIALITVVAQVLFSEQILSRWIRMEWLRFRVERVYDDVYLFMSSAGRQAAKDLRAKTIQCLVKYETSKAQAGVSLSSRAFRALNSSLTEEWNALAERFRE